MNGRSSFSPIRQRLAAAGLSGNDLAGILEMNTKNAGGGYVEIGGEQLVIRAASRITAPAQIAKFR